MSGPKYPARKVRLKAIEVLGFDPYDWFLKRPPWRGMGCADQKSEAARKYFAARGELEEYQ